MKIYTKEESKKEIGKLVVSFDEKIDFYKSNQYKEANLEDEYLKPLLRYLNWNISNEGIQNLANREVIVQVKGKQGKEPDYLLQLDTKPKFYIEAKHPKYKLWNEIKYIWQAYAYAYSTQCSPERKKVDFSLLTDFEEFRFFDCTFKAEKSTVQNFVVIDWQYPHYVDKFDDLWDLFEKEQVRKGSLESLYLNEKKIKQNRIPPDKAFLTDLDDEKKGWRIQLAKDIKKHNPEFGSEYITRAVQIILDRFIFIKVLSDREIEEDYLAQIIENIDKAFLNSEKGVLDESCKDIFVKLNKIYNGSIFSPRPETRNLTLSNKALHSVLNDFLPENSRYNFKQIPVEVLGTIYEQFLGKVIHTTDKRVKVEYKPEVRKAGGVYYTPQYIVDYIVENTVGEKLKECKCIEDVFNIKICDPACGSGSFLLGAYDILIHWCIDFYSKKIKPGTKLTKKQLELIYLDLDNQIRLTSKLKRDLLRNCIFGVDIDHQAVEVAITSLSLKALEDTKHDELYAEVDLFHESVLPNLDDNIKCGNSLIGMDINNGKLEFSKEEEKKLNPFDWKSEFKVIFEKGGFDCVIGNPPYVRIQTTNANDIDYFSEKYISATKNYDIYCLFVEKGINLLNSNGDFSFILPHRFLKNGYGIGLRDYLSKAKYVNEIIDFDGFMVFTASINTCILTATKRKNDEINYFKIKDSNEKAEKIDSIIRTKSNNLYKCVTSNNFNNQPWYFIDKSESDLWNSLCIIKTKLSDVTESIFQGIKTGADTVFILDFISETDKYYTAKSKSLNLNLEIEKDIVFELIKSGNMKPFNILKSKKIIIFPYKHGKLLPLSELKNNYINIYNYLVENRKLLERRDGGKWKCPTWYGYSRSQALNVMQYKKILTPDYFSGPCFCLDNEGRYFFTGGGAGGYGILPKNNISHLYLLALLNSKIVNWYHQKISLRAYQTAYLYSKNYITNLPIITPEANSKFYIDITKNTKKIIEEYKLLQLAQTEQEKIQTQRKIDYLEKEINALVYQLYELTPKEIKIIEGIETGKPRIPGAMKGKIKLSPDFDEPLDDFKEYME